MQINSIDVNGLSFETLNFWSKDDVQKYLDGEDFGKKRILQFVATAI